MAPVFSKRSALRTVVIEDQDVIRLDLLLQLRKFTEIEVVGEARNLEEAREAVATLRPDVLFLDVELGDGLGFDILPASVNGPRIVFVSAHNSYAVRAFEVNALDYLVKPVRPERLAQTVSRLVRSAGAEIPETPLNLDDRYFIPIGETLGFVAIGTILRLETEGNYTSLLTIDGKKVEVKQSLAIWERRLPVEHFVRINRNEIVQWRYILRVGADEAGRHLLYLQGESEPRGISRRAWSSLNERIRSRVEK